MTNREFAQLLAYARLGKSEAVLKTEIEQAVKEAEAIANFACDDAQSRAFSLMREDHAASSVKREELLRNSAQAKDGFFYLPEEGTL